MMQEPVRSRSTLLPSVSVRGLLFWVAVAAAGASVAAGAMQGNHLALAAAASLGLLIVTFAVYAVSGAVVWAGAVVLMRRRFEDPGPFRPERPQAPVPRDLAGEEP